MTENSVEQHGLGKSILLHLFPGVLIGIFFALTAPLVIEAGYPAIVALLLGVLLVLIPVELGFLYYQGRKLNDSNSLRGIVLYREPIPIWQYLVLVIPLLVWAGLLFTMAAPLDNFFIDNLFGWLPDWYFFGEFTENLSDYSSTALIVTVVLTLILNGVAGPVVEELYFRGYLLPRISRFGKWAPVVNTVLFSIYHFWSPWQILLRIVAILPMVSVVYWKRNIYVGILQHVLLNTISGLLIVGLILSQS